MINLVPQDRSTNQLQSANSCLETNTKVFLLATRFQLQRRKIRRAKSPTYKVQRQTRLKLVIRVPYLGKKDWLTIENQKAVGRNSKIKWIQSLHTMTPTSRKNSSSTISKYMPRKQLFMPMIIRANGYNSKLGTTQSRVLLARDPSVECMKDFVVLQDNHSRLSKFKFVPAMETYCKRRKSKLCKKKRNYFPNYVIKISCDSSELITTENFTTCFQSLFRVVHSKIFVKNKVVLANLQQLYTPSKFCREQNTSTSKTLSTVT